MKTLKAFCMVADYTKSWRHFARKIRVCLASSVVL